MSLFHENLENYFKTNFLLMQEHKYSLTEIESWVPWERQVYISMLIQHLKTVSYTHLTLPTNREV